MLHHLQGDRLQTLIGPVFAIIEAPFCSCRDMKQESEDAVCFQIEGDI